MIQFGTDGWRAIIDKDFTDDNIIRVIGGLSDYLNQKGGGGEIFLGFDRRKRSVEAAALTAEILTGEGFDVHSASSYCPTPCIAWNTRSHKARAGVMITASHNPSEWNGIKFKEEDGGAASEEYTREVERLIANRRDRKVTRLKPLHDFDPRQDYVTALRKGTAVDEIKRCGWKIGYDPIFGAGAGYLARTLEAPVDEIHSEQDTTFGGLNPEPIEKNLGPLIERVQEKRLDVGLATDGDADRVGAIDEEGRFVDSHHIFALILKHLVTVLRLSGDVIKTVSTTQMIDRLAEKYRLTLQETPIGFKHICKKFRETNPMIGGEESGGIAVAQWMFERDGLFASLLLLQIMSHHRKRLGELVRELHAEVGPHFFSRKDLRLDPPTTEKIRAALPTRKIERIAGHPVLSRNNLDGCKFFLSGGGWLLIRPSGTEPVLRIYAEAADPAEVEKILRGAEELL